MDKTQNITTFDTRIAFKGERGTFIRKKLDEKMASESRNTYGNAIEDILAKHFGWDKKPQTSK